VSHRSPSFPEPYLRTETESKIIDDILKLLNKHGLTSQQSMNLLERLGGIMRWGNGWRRGRRTEGGSRLQRSTRSTDYAYVRFFRFFICPPAPSIAPKIMLSSSRMSLHQALRTLLRPALIS